MLSSKGILRPHDHWMTVEIRQPSPSDLQLNMRCIRSSDMLMLVDKGLTARERGDASKERHKRNRLPRLPCILVDGCSFGFPGLDLQQRPTLD